MRSIIFGWTVVFCLNCKTTKPAHWLSIEYKASAYNASCKFTDQYTLEERLKKIPFDQAKRVELIAYDGGPIVEPLGNEQDPNAGLPRILLSLEDSTFLDRPVFERILLSQIQLDHLTSILFNYGYWRDEKEVIKFVGPSCYSPQHMLLFYNSTSEQVPFARLEICLQCIAYRTYPKKIDFGIFCEGKYDLLREFFRQVGIKHGL